jgi:hypothetical protein
VKLTSVIAFAGIVVMITCAIAIIIISHENANHEDRPSDYKSKSLNRYRDEERHVTCYAAMGKDGLSCIRDVEPMPSCSQVPK